MNRKLPHRHKLVVAGNHDFVFMHQRDVAIATLSYATYLEDTGITLEGIRFYGSPWQPWFMDYAFNLEQAEQLAERWARIPERTDILITHCPPFGMLDQNRQGEHRGCHELLYAVANIRPKLHIFGHIHESYGISEQHGRWSINASSCNHRHRPNNPPIIVDTVHDGHSIRVQSVREQADGT